jgi:hypothetical protein
MLETRREEVRKMAERTTETEELALEELEAQAGGLLPARVEMRRRRHGRRRFRQAVFVTGGVTCPPGAECKFEIKPPD